jgi:polyhydroxyalkanoate synthase
MKGWYGENLPGRGEWRIDGAPVDPAQLRCPCFVAAPARDRIVTPASAVRLAEAISGAHLHRPAAGHIGMATGPRAEEVLWRPLLDWLRGLRTII